MREARHPINNRYRFTLSASAEAGIRPGLPGPRVLTAPQGTTKPLMNECRENNVGSLGKDTSFPAAKGLSNEKEPSDLMLRENGALRSPGS